MNLGSISIVYNSFRDQGSINTHMYIYIYIIMYVCIYIYIDMYKESISPATASIEELNAWKALLLARLITEAEACLQNFM